MSAVIAIVALGMLAAICGVAGAYLIAGTGVALLTAGAVLAFTSWWLSKGVKVETR